MQTRKSITSNILCSLLILMILVAPLLSEDHHEHYCIGEQCKICFVVNQYKKTIGFMGLCSVSSIMVGLSVVGLHRCFISLKEIRVYDTPISLKVKLLN